MASIRKYLRMLRLERHTCYGTFGTRISAERVVELIGVSLRTAQRWITKPETVPALERELLEIKALGLIPDPAFEGWCVEKGVLISPMDRRLNTSEIEGLSYIHQRASWQDRIIEKLESEIDALRQENHELRLKLKLPTAANDES